MAAITISREIGSKGDFIAEETARRLGYPLVDKDTLEKIFRQYGFVDFKEVYDETGFWAQFDPRRVETVSFLNQVIRTLAYHGNIVLLGRGGFAPLKGNADVLNVRIKAPYALRVQRVRTSQFFVSQADAEQYVLANDALRRNFVNSFYSEHWDSLSAFDLVIDTGKIQAQQAVDWLEALAHSLEQATPDQETQTTQAMEIDPVLLDSVRQVLDRQPVPAA